MGKWKANEKQAAMKSKIEILWVNEKLMKSNLQWKVI